MPDFRVISDQNTWSAQRVPRGLEAPAGHERIITIIQARDMAHALTQALVRTHAKRRIVAVEEIHPGLQVTTAQIEDAFRAIDANTDAPYFEPAHFADATEALYAGFDFISSVKDVVGVLRDEKLVPGLSLSVTDDEEGYAMVEVFDAAQRRYVSHGIELKHLTDDRLAVGWQGLHAIARALIAATNSLH